MIHLGSSDGETEWPEGKKDDGETEWPEEGKKGDGEKVYGEKGENGENGEETEKQEIVVVET